jgi:hypothetical protein
MPQTLREFFLAKTERRYAKVIFPDGYVAGGLNPGVRSLTDRELRAFERESQNAKGRERQDRLEDAARRLVIITAINLDTNELIFDEFDVGSLEEVDSMVVSAFYNAALKHIGWTAGDVEELVKNSEGTGGDKPS